MHQRTHWQALLRMKVGFIALDFNISHVYLNNHKVRT